MSSIKVLNLDSQVQYSPLSKGTFSRPAANNDADLTQLFSSKSGNNPVNVNIPPHVHGQLQETENYFSTVSALENFLENVKNPLTASFLYGGKASLGLEVRKSKMYRL